MKRFLYVGAVMLVVIGLLGGCKESEDAKGTPKVEKAEVKETTPKEEQKTKDSEPVAEKGTPEWDLQQIEKAVDTDDEDLFMSYQNPDNPVFFKEQKRWIEEAKFKKKQGYTLSVNLYGFQQENETTATVSFAVQMSHPKLGSTTNIVKYRMMNANNKWILNDAPFETLKSDSGILTVYFMKGEEAAAKQTLKDASDIIQFYSKQFNWKPNPISIKIYPNSQAVSATVPWIALGGWNEIGESLKITTDAAEKIFPFLAHELTHKMIGDLSNDNATIYIQEGIATYFQGTVVRNQAGNVAYDPKIADEKAKKAIEVKNSVKTIEELGKIDYTDPEGSMYRDGFLLSNYLIHQKGLPTFFNMVRYLSKFEYIDDRAEHKMEQAQLQTVEAIGETYGPSDRVSSDCIAYYIK